MVSVLPTKAHHLQTMIVDAVQLWKDQKEISDRPWHSHILKIRDTTILWEEKKRGSESVHKLCDVIYERFVVKFWFCSKMQTNNSLKIWNPMWVLFWRSFNGLQAFVEPIWKLEPKYEIVCQTMKQTMKWQGYQVKIFLSTWGVLIKMP